MTSESNTFIYPRIFLVTIIFVAGILYQGFSQEIRTVKARRTEEAGEVLRNSEKEPAKNFLLEHLKNIASAPPLDIPRPDPKQLKDAEVDAPGDERLIMYNFAKKDFKTEMISPVPNHLKQNQRSPASVEKFSPLRKTAHPKPLNNNGLRETCKIWTSFVGGVAYVGSGVLIHPSYVLTAGHTLYTAREGWPTNVFVVPSYEYDGSLFGKRPYGAAIPIKIGVFGGWFERRDYRHDMGIIKLDSPLGLKTKAGHSYHRYDNNDNFFLNTILENPGYPDELPYQGRYMHNWKGKADSVSPFKISFLSVSYKGQSGGGLLRSRSGLTSQVYGVLSAMPEKNQTDFTRMTSAKYSEIKRKIAAGLKGHDLIPISVKLRNSNITPGDRLSDMNYIIYNDGSQTWKKNVEARVYLSENDYISTSDQLIDKPHVFSTHIEPQSAIKILVPSPLIPADKKNGKYWVGVILNISDTNTDNNTTQYSDAAPITVVDQESASRNKPVNSLKPNQLSLSNTPNPFNPTTRIRFELPIGTNVRLVIYNSLGEQVAHLVENEYLNVGSHQYEWDASLLPSGLYFAQIQTERAVKVHKMMLIK